MNVTAQSKRPMKQPSTQKAIDATMLPDWASCCCAILTAWRSMLIRATIREPKLMLPKEYVIDRRKAPLVTPFGMPPGLPLQKYHLKGRVSLVRMGNDEREAYEP